MLTSKNQWQEEGFVMQVLFSVLLIPSLRMIEMIKLTTENLYLQVTAVIPSCIHIKRP